METIKQSGKQGFQFVPPFFYPSSLPGSYIQLLEIENTLVASKKLTLSDTGLFLHCRILVDKLLLNEAELIEVTLEEGHLLLLRLGVGGLDDGVVVLPKIIQLDLKLDDLEMMEFVSASLDQRGEAKPMRYDLLASVLQVAHEAPLRALEI